MVISLFLDEIIFTLLRVWESEFGIPNQYSDFKITLDLELWDPGETTEPENSKNSLTSCT